MGALLPWGVLPNCCVRCRWCCPKGGSARRRPRTYCSCVDVPRGAPGRAALSFAAPAQGCGSATARSGLVTVFVLLAGRLLSGPERWRGRRGLLKKVTLAPQLLCPRRPAKTQGATCARVDGTRRRSQHCSKREPPPQPQKRGVEAAPRAAQSHGRGRQRPRSVANHGRADGGVAALRRPVL